MIKGIDHVNEQWRGGGGGAAQQAPRSRRRGRIKKR
jgi:hypothetical protein